MNVSIAGNVNSVLLFVVPGFFKQGKLVIPMKDLGSLALLAGEVSFLAMSFRDSVTGKRFSRKVLWEFVSGLAKVRKIVLVSKASYEAWWDHTPDNLLQHESIGKVNLPDRSVYVLPVPAVKRLILDSDRVKLVECNLSKLGEINV